MQASPVTSRPRCSGLEVVVVGQLQGASEVLQPNGPIHSVPHASHQPHQPVSPPKDKTSISTHMSI